MHSLTCGEYDIKLKLVEKKMYNLAIAIAYYFTRYSNAVKTVIIARGFMNNFELIEQEMLRGLSDFGLDVVLIGVVTVPILNFSFNIFPAQASIMINLLEYNYLEVKIYINKEIIWGDKLKVISDIFYTKQLRKTFIKGNYKNCPIIDGYIAWLAQRFQHLKDFAKPIKINCQSEATFKIITDLFNKISLKNFDISINNTDNNLFFTNTELNFNIDYDSGKLTVLNMNNKEINSDKIIAIYVKDIIEKNPKGTVIYDNGCALDLDKLLINLNVKFYRISSDFINIKKVIKEYNAIFAGDLNGRFYFKDNYFGYDDAIYSMLRLIDIVHKNNKNLDELCKEAFGFCNKSNLVTSCDKELLAGN